MIFVTIGSVFPFDRLIRAMDAWAAARGDASEEILAQVGTDGWRPAHMRGVARLETADYAAAVARARLVVAHAGVGAVITAGEYGRPIVVLPRRMHLGEHVSDHQMETVVWLRGKPGVHLAETEADLPAAIAAASACGETGPRVAGSADPAFIARLRAFMLK